MTSGDRAPAAPGVLRVHWIPGTDQLLGTCHCGAEHVALDPVELWDWMHAHPVGHHRRQRSDADPQADPNPASAEPEPAGHAGAHRVLTPR